MINIWVYPIFLPPHVFKVKIIIDACSDRDGLFTEYTFQSTIMDRGVVYWLKHPISSWPPEIRGNL